MKCERADGSSSCIDEAQNSNENVLESVRVLSNFETPWMKLVQIVIAGSAAIGRTPGAPFDGAASPKDFVRHSP